MRHYWLPYYTNDYKYYSLSFPSTTANELWVGSWLLRIEGKRGRGALCNLTRRVVVQWKSFIQLKKFSTKCYKNLIFYNFTCWYVFKKRVHQKLMYCVILCCLFINSTIYVFICVHNVYTECYSLAIVRKLMWSQKM